MMRFSSSSEREYWAPLARWSAKRALMSSREMGSPPEPRKRVNLRVRLRGGGASRSGRGMQINGTRLGRISDVLKSFSDGRAGSTSARPDELEGGRGVSVAEESLSLVEELLTDLASDFRLGTASQSRTEKARQGEEKRLTETAALLMRYSTGIETGGRRAATGRDSRVKTWSK